MFGRLICGFLCPFGWFQELLHKIPTKKFSTKKLHFLTYLKYVILVVFVILLPILVRNDVNMANCIFRMNKTGMKLASVPVILFNNVTSTVFSATSIS